MTGGETFAIGLAAALLAAPYVPRLCRRVRRVVIALALRRVLRTLRPQERALWRLRYREDRRQREAYAGLASVAMARSVVRQAIEAAEPGRQRVRMPAGGPFDTPWSMIPKEAKSGPWEDFHTFPPGGKPKRDSVFGLQGEAPLSFVCMACELEQPPITQTERVCPYCGLRLQRHGSRLYWWRPSLPEVPEWEPKR